jgi:hypothetical protein
MGLDPSRVSENSGQPAFSRDVFQVEICGPNEDHLTVIDVPGK